VPKYPRAVAGLFLLILALLLSSCRATPAATPGDTPPVSAAENATVTPSVVSTAQTGRPVLGTATPAPGILPAASPLPPTVTLPPPTMTLLPTPSPPPVLDPAAQQAALRPEFAGDLAGAANWDRYRVDAYLDPAGLTIAGTLRLALVNRSSEPFNDVYFHMYPNHPDFGGELTVSEVLVDGRPAATGTEQNAVLLRVALAEPLAPDQWAQLELSFTTRSQRNASGRAYGAFNQESGVWALANFHPVLARYFVGSGWDRREVSSRGDLAVTTTALYDVTLTTPADWELATTGVRVSTRTLADGRRQDRFVSGPQRDFFLAALRGLERASSEVDGTRIVAYYQPDNRLAGERSLQVAEQSLRVFNQRYGAYPFAEMDVIQAALTRFLGVEYPGIMLIEQNLYRQNGRGLVTTVAHEVAHQWWYSQVGNDFQGEPWLDEGLASFSQIIYFEGIGDPASAELELQNFRDIYLGARNAGRDGAVDRATSAFRGNYVALVYAKAALFFQALRERIGEEAFQAFLRDYYRTYRYREATGPGLLARAEAACACELDDFYRDWIRTAAAVEVP
jgi:hypothetical protein